MSIDLAARRAELLRLREGIVRAATDLAADDEGVGEINSAAGTSTSRTTRPTSSTSRSTMALGENADNVIAEIDDALGRIEAGTYGTCAVCGAVIPEERLAAIPYATLCLDDKRRKEHG